MSGLQSARACPSCGASVDDGEVRFCGRCGADLRTAPLRKTDPSMELALPQDPMIGRTIDGRYRVQERIGQGGMGVVYRVEHVAMGKVAAMKMLHPSLTQDAEVVRRFRREAEAVSRLSHPNTVQVFDFGEAMGSLYLVMELIRGEDLGALLRRDGPFVWERLAPVLSQVLDALIEAHELGVIHRDIKPENLFISRTRDGKDLVKVLDFGLAKLRDVEEVSGVTGRGTVIGTPYYMSPEQIRAEDLDARSDLYSLGALGYRALTGEHPFAAATPVAVLTQHLTARLPLLRERSPSRNIPALAEAVIMQAMERLPANRFQSAEEMRRAVQDTLNGQRMESAPAIETARRASDTSSPAVTAVGVAERMKREDFDSYERGLRVRRILALSILPLLLVLGAGAAYFFLLRDQGATVRDSENEPNDDPTHANALVSGKPMQGQIGKRRTVEESDRDFYHLVVDKGQNRLNAEVSSIPDMDLMLHVFDSAGHEIAESDSGGEGQPENIYDLRVGPGDVYVQVREVWIGGRQATENISDYYSLRVVVDAAPADVELEPNNSEEQANPIEPTKVVSGHLFSESDVDCFAMSSPPAAPPKTYSLSAQMTGIAGASVWIRAHAHGETMTAKSATSRAAESRAAGDGCKLAKQPWTGTGSPVVCVGRVAPPVDDKSGARPHNRHHGVLAGRDTPYQLSIELSR